MKYFLKVLMILILGSMLVLNACTNREHGFGGSGGFEGSESSGESHGSREMGGEGQGGDAAEQTGTYKLSETYDHVVNGMRLIISYDSQVNAFVGTVENTLTTTLSDVRVEVHQSNGIELGPTQRMDLSPGQKIPVRLDAVGTFGTWTAHPETGTETGHGGGEGAEGSGEHSSGGSEGSGEHGSGRTEGSGSSEGSGEHGSGRSGSSEGSGEHGSGRSGEHGSGGSEGSGESHSGGDRG